MQSKVKIAAVSQVKCEEKWQLGLMDLAVEAASAVLQQDSKSRPSAVVLANAMGDALGDQRSAATYLASALGLTGVETVSVASDEASGGMAIRQGLMNIWSGAHDCVLVVGAEKTSDPLPEALEAICARGLDAAGEACFGFTPTVSAALGMDRYLQSYKISKEMCYHIASTAHQNAADNQNAYFRWPLSERKYAAAPMVATPLNLFDVAPVCDGAAAVLLQRVADVQRDDVCIVGSANRAEQTGIVHTVQALELPAARSSAALALESAKMSLENVSIFELHDSNVFLATLSLEAVGLATAGGALIAASSGRFLVGGSTPVWTGGGMKARGNAVGASGVYQLVDAYLRLKTGAVSDGKPSAALVQCLGSFGAQAVTHVLQSGGERDADC